MFIETSAKEGFNIKLLFRRLATVRGPRRRSPSAARRSPPAARRRRPCRRWRRASATDTTVVAVDDGAARRREGCRAGRRLRRGLLLRRI